MDSSALVLLLLSANVYSVEIGGINYTLNYSNNTAMVISLYGVDNHYSGDIVIPSTVVFSDETYVVTSINTGAFRDCSYLTSVEIPENVTNIGGSAFANCTQLTSINIPKGITTLENTFQNCVNLSSITLPEGLITIGNCTFDGCTGLTDIIIPATVETIGKYAFFGCNQLLKLTIPNSVKSVGFYAFAHCEGLQQLTVGNGVNAWGEDSNTSYYGMCFSSCISLSSIHFEEGLRSISNGAFNNCTSLTSIIIPQSIERMEYCPFSSCDNLISVTVKSEDPNDITLINQAFSNASNATLYVPIGCKAAYETTNYWKDFKEIIEVQKCATPTISFVGGKLHFACETEGVTFHYSVTTPTFDDGTGNDISLSSNYIIKVYATKDDYVDSDVASTVINVAGIKGDVNQDGKVSITDAVSVVNIILGNE